MLGFLFHVTAWFTVLFGAARAIAAASRNPGRKMRALEFLVRNSRIAVPVMAALMLVTLGCGSDSSTKQSQSADPPEAVFIGSSQTADWIFSQNFAGKNFVKTGEGSDTSADMLARFKRDVLDLKPRVVVIWAGENDIDRGLPLDQPRNNIAAMRQQAIDAGVRVVLCTLSPKTGASASQNPAIVEFNNLLRKFAADTATALADFYPALIDSNGALKAEFANGQEHLTSAAYAAISPIASAAITAAEK